MNLLRITRASSKQCEERQRQQRDGGAHDNEPIAMVRYDALRIVAHVWLAFNVARQIEAGEWEVYNRVDLGSCRSSPTKSLQHDDQHLQCMIPTIPTSEQVSR